MGAMYIKMISVLMEKIDMGKLNLMELDLLEKYLKEHGFMYKRIDEEYKSLYKKYRKPQGMILKVVKTLFDSRLYSPLDLLMSYIMRRNTAK